MINTMKFNKQNFLMMQRSIVSLSNTILEQAKVISIKNKKIKNLKHNDRRKYYK